MKFMRDSILPFVTPMVVACGGDGLPTPTESNRPQAVEDRSGNSGATAAAVVPVGPADTDTIQIGERVWRRTLPMTPVSASCTKRNGTLPTRATAWGTLDHEDDVRFSVRHKQDGTFEAENQSRTYYWIAGARSIGVDDIQIELDFESLTITGQGIFTNIYTSESMHGSFNIQCEEE